MDPSKIPIWSCISGRASCSTPLKVVKNLSKVNFNGKKNGFSFDHIIQFILNYNNCDIDEDVMCSIFTFTLTDQAKY